jgi:gentisate 1,2-dioxygenase
MNGTSDPSKDLDAFMSAFSYPARQGLLIQNVTEHPVHPRADRGNSAAYFSFPELKTLEAHLSEIPPGEATGLHRHSCEALFYVLAGKGYSTVRQDGDTERRIDWQAGDLFFTPIHAWHRHFNADPLRPARYLEITTIPLMKSLGAWYIEAADEQPG